jgi:hypothetical protein
MPPTCGNAADDKDCGNAACHNSCGNAADDNCNAAVVFLLTTLNHLELSNAEDLPRLRQMHKTCSPKPLSGGLLETCRAHSSHQFHQEDHQAIAIVLEACDDDSNFTLVFNKIINMQ